MFTPIHSPEEAQFYLDPKGQTLTPTFAFNFSQNFADLRETILCNHNIFFIVDEDVRGHLTICGNAGHIPPHVLEELRDAKSGEALVQMRMQSIPLIRLTYTLNDTEILMLHDGLMHSSHWALIILTPKESLRVLVRKVTSAIESTQMLAWNEVPRF